VWAKLLDFPLHAEWDPVFERIEGTAVQEQDLRMKLRKPDGTGMVFTPRVLDVQKDRYLRWQGKMGSHSSFRARTGSHRLIPEDGGNSTILHHGEDVRGILLPLLGSRLQEMETGFEAFNKALAKQVEAMPVK
jgi:hypothetical protein